MCLGKPNQIYKEIIKNYQKKVNYFVDSSFVYLKDFSNLNKNECLKKEEKILLDYINKNNNYNYYLFSIKANIHSSETFTDIIQKEQILNKGIVFIIGGSYGVLEENLKIKNKISFGKITLPHQLFQLVALEQLYRAFTIINNRKYHK